MSSAAYLIEQLQQMMINMHQTTGSGTKADVYEGINAILSFLLGHHLLFDSKLKTKAELSKSIYGEMPGPQGSMPLLGFEVETSQSKPRIMGTARHKHVEVCLICAYALSLWYRFDFEDGPLFGDKRPDFLDRSEWNPYKLLFDSTPESTRKEPISNDRDAQLVQKCGDSIGLNLPSIENYQANRAGEMKNVVIEKSSHSYLPAEFILFSSGFPIQQPYYISRNVTPPIELEKKIFPFVEDILPLVLKQESDDLAAGRPNDGMAITFLEMLQQFRAFILQDLAVLVDKAPNSVFCHNPITKDPLFCEFKKLVDASTKIPSTFETMSPSKLLPNVFSIFTTPTYDITESELQRYEFIRNNRFDPDDDRTDELLLQIEQWSMRMPPTAANKKMWSLMQTEAVTQSFRR